LATLVLGLLANLSNGDVKAVRFMPCARKPFLKDYNTCLRITYTKDRKNGRFEFSGLKGGSPWSWKGPMFTARGKEIDNAEVSLTAHTSRISEVKISNSNTKEWYHLHLDLRTGKVTDMAGECPFGWNKYSDKCYLSSDLSGVNFFEANRYCIQKGGHLMEPRTKADRIVLNKYFNDGKYYWFGLTDLAQEGVFQWWSDYSDLTTASASWFSGEPNNGFGNEGCVMSFSNVVFLWNDLDCFQSTSDFQLPTGSKPQPIFALCERPLLSSTTP